MFKRIILAIVAMSLVIATGVFAYVAATPQLTPTAIQAAPSLQTTQNDAGIFVSGTGRVSVKPNMVLASIGIEITASNFAEATSQANTKANAIIEKIKSMGVADKDIQTTNFSVQPITQQRPNTTPTITGYRINNQLSVRIRKMEDAGKILDAAMTAGANNIYGVSFTVDDPTPYQQQARAAAVKDAMDKAGQLAKAANIQLGKVLTISEGSAAPRPLIRSFAAPAAMDAAAVPLEGGELEISVTVEMKFAVP
ncbi:MAG: SIMPL domain-containing protein [Chloroflexi bacterium]|nr:SIMPL domain-containing protein [Chloroflexota bacterium]